MEVKITVTTTWKVAPKDEALVKELIEAYPVDTALDYLDDAAAGGKEFSLLEAKFEIKEG